MLLSEEESKLSHLHCLVISDRQVFVPIANIFSLVALPQLAPEGKNWADGWMDVQAESRRELGNSSECTIVWLGGGQVRVRIHHPITMKLFN